MIVVALFLALTGVVTAAWEGSATQAVFNSKETCEAYVAAGSDGTCDVNTNGCVHIQTTTKTVRHQDYVCSTATAHAATYSDKIEWLCEGQVLKQRVTNGCSDDCSDCSNANANPPVLNTFPPDQDFLVTGQCLQVTDASGTILHYVFHDDIVNAVGTWSDPTNWLPSGASDLPSCGAGAPSGLHLSASDARVVFGPNGECSISLDSTGTKLTSNCDIVYEGGAGSE